MGSTTLYGQGNFLFDRSDSELWQTGLLAVVALEPEGAEDSFLPLRKDGPRVLLAEGEDAEAIIEGFRECSEEITRPGFVEGRYAEFAWESLPSYLMRFAGPTLPAKVLRKLTGGRWPATYYGRTERLAIQNVLDCEAHRELASMVCLLKMADSIRSDLQMNCLPN